MPVDPDVVRRLLRIVRDHLRILHDYRAMDRNEFLSEAGRMLAVKHALQVMTQALIDLGLHVCAASGVNGLETYRETARELAKAGLLTAPLAEILEQMIGLRNLLVHGYADISEHRLLGFLDERIDDFASIADGLERSLRERGVLS